MRNNEDGFTMVEGLLSLSIAIIICVLLFPLLFKMLLNLIDGKNDLIASRLLYEHVEQQLPIKAPSYEIRTFRNIQYELSIEKNANDFWRACVKYAERQICHE
ncbi:hypothetical protein ACFFF5_01130 [Lederbergia wuyishanensis]|uniref:Type II secretion system protein n=1 Tax=Lederbergia wuyishanensis TaxID=1347903 RepID=A0ABU0D1B6_9BACI|nr:type II secretion system protein [Lederbergia wuyishanensis]MCJ8006819.1 type II secretion system GspH family protein [Lederbergia wuyishanensis]MDQ0342203.1 hypothetical protein [Lederbergia wuyishanensis]